MNERFFVFDWDGTLANSVPIIVASIQEAAMEIGETIPEEKASHIIGLGLNDARAYLFPHISDEQVLEKFNSTYRTLYKEKEDTIDLYPGAIDLLTFLKESNYYLSIATGKSRRGLDRALEITGIGSFFSASRTSDETAPKPAPDMIYDIAAKLDRDSADAVVIGDTTYDITMAHNAGAWVIAVTHGAHKPEALAAAKPHGMFASLPEIQNFLLHLF